MRKNIFLLSVILVIVVISVALAVMVIFSATKPEKHPAPVKAVVPISVKPELPGRPVENGAVTNASVVSATKSEEKVPELPMPVTEKPLQEEGAKVTSGAPPDQATVIGLQVLPVDSAGKSTAELPAFIPTTNTTGPVPIVPTTSKTQDITSFVPKPSVTGPVAKEGGAEHKDLPPFTPVTSPTGPVRKENQ
ncbi:MAG: hypothetical protein WC522_02245 [Candidatus Omnitrophota bacterium]